jgi:hypothetical protein
MKLSIPFIMAFLLLISCGTDKNNIADQKFQNNSKTILASLERFQNQKADYSSFSKDFKSLSTNFSDTTESINLDEYIENNKKMLEILQFKLVETPVFLRGVDSETGMVDGSVRYYGVWEITLKKTPTTEAKTARLKVYESFDFDEDGKILIQQAYGDFSALTSFIFSE